MNLFKVLFYQSSHGGTLFHSARVLCHSKEAKYGKQKLKEEINGIRRVA